MDVWLKGTEMTDGTYSEACVGVEGREILGKNDCSVGNIAPEKIKGLQ